MMSRVRMSAGCVLLAVPFVAVQAQNAEPKRGVFLVGGGVDPTTTEGTGYRPALTLHAGYERRIGESRFGVRVEGDYWRQMTRYSAVVDGLPLADVARTRTISGISALATYRFAQAGRVQPYALAGIGAKELSLRNETEWSDRSRVVTATPQRQWSPALAAGFGTFVRLGRASLFAEARATLLTRGAGDHDIQGVQYPLTLGVRF